MKSWLADAWAKFVDLLHRAHLAAWLWAFLPPVSAWVLVPREYLVIAWEKHPLVLLGVTLIFFIQLTLMVIFAKKWFISKALLTRIGAVLTAAYPTRDNKKAAQFRFQVRNQILDDLRISKRLRVLGATGYNTFARGGKDWIGEDNSFLYEILSDAMPYTRIEVLLIHPQSTYISTRANQLGMSIEKYAEEIQQSIKRCSELKKEGKDIHCYLYRERPLVWKLIISDKHVWQQAYPVDGHVEFSGINLFKKRGDADQLLIENSNSLYSPFSILFDLLRDTGCTEVPLP